MRRLVPIYIYQKKGWPGFTWDNEVLLPVLTDVRHKQGRLAGYMELLGFAMRSEEALQTITDDILKSNEIEGELLNAAEVRSSVARHLGIHVAGLVRAGKEVDAVVEMMLDATQNHDKALTAERLFGWHSSLFPSGRSGMHKITTGNWRKNDKGPMQVVSGAMGKEKVHYEAPDAKFVKKEMSLFFKWFNAKQNLDPVLKSGVAHLWFVTIHPFDDGNGRIARAIADMQLTKADDYSKRFYSMSAQIQQERKVYYSILEKTQKGSMDITAWLHWYLNCLSRAISATDKRLQAILQKTKFWDKHIHTEINERQRYMINKLFDGFDGKLNTSKWAKITKCSPDTALRDIQDLMKKKILMKEEAGGRSTNYFLKHI
jgi:Fic family protein